MAIAGKVAPVPKGEWNATTNYEKLNLVTNNNEVFIAKTSSQGQTPISGTTNDYWMFLMDSSGSIATTTSAGKVKPDGNTISVDDSGKISGVGVIDKNDGAKPIQFSITDDGLLRVFYDGE